MKETVQELKMEMEKKIKLKQREFWKWRVWVLKQELQMGASPTEYGDGRENLRH